MLRVLSYNIRHAEGIDGRVHLPRVASVIRAADVDVACLQEVDRFVDRTRGIDQPEVLAALTGMHAVFGPNLALQRGDYGNLILSRRRAAGWRNVSLPVTAGEEPRGCAIVSLRHGSIEVTVACCHLALLAEDRLAEAAALLADLPRDRPLVLCGDFNEEPGGSAVSLLAAVLRDAATEPTSAAGEATFATDGSRAVRIDYVLCGFGAKPASAEVLRDGAARVASDHRPLLARVDLGG